VDRSHAIGWSLNQLKPGDILLIAGKGHETEQIIGTHSFPHSDASCVRQHPSFELEK
jgi:UDP-N-acetylmuramoyl-L-alanyl-D-glutamate--2,6-diaminopimelate ligase